MTEQTFTHVERSHSGNLPVICRAAFKGEVTNEEYDAVIKYIKDMQMRDWVWMIAYTEGRGEKIYIDYVMEKHGI